MKSFKQYTSEDKQINENAGLPSLWRLLKLILKGSPAEVLTPGYGVTPVLDDRGIGHDSVLPFYGPPDDGGNWVWDPIRLIYSSDDDGDGVPDRWYGQDLAGEGQYYTNPPWEPAPYTPILGPLLSEPDWTPNSIGDGPPPVDYPDYGDGQIFR